MYTEIGSFNAKAQLSRLLQEVQRGHRYTITLRGHPVADLVPSEQAPFRDSAAAIQAMRNIDKVTDVSAEQVSNWIAEGRQ